MTDRTRLANRRACMTYEFWLEGVRYYGSIGWLGAPGASPIGEIFLTGGKPNSAVDSTAMDAGILASLALQSGVSAADLRRALGRPCDRGGGPIAAVLELAESDSVSAVQKSDQPGGSPADGPHTGQDGATLSTNQDAPR
jgi:hypothetical protein